MTEIEAQVEQAVAKWLFFMEPHVREGLQRAVRLLMDVLTPAERQEYLDSEFVTVGGPDGEMFRIRRDMPRVQWFVNGVLRDQGCAQAYFARRQDGTALPFPPDTFWYASNGLVSTVDIMTAKILMAKYDPARLKQTVQWGWRKERS